MEVRATIFRWRIWRFLFTLRGLWNAFDFFGWSLLMLPFPHDTMLERGVSSTRPSTWKKRFSPRDLAASRTMLAAHVLCSICLASPGSAGVPRTPFSARPPIPGRTLRRRASPAAAAQLVPPTWGERTCHFLDANSFPVGMALAVAAARIAPGVGANGGPLMLDFTVGRLGVAAIFFLSGLGIRLSELAAAATSFRLNALVQLALFGIWPAMAWLAVRLARLVGTPFSPPLLDGFLVTACLPTTVNMCVLLTQSAGGNVALAITNAVLSNALGVFVTPLLLLSLMGQTIDVKLASICVKLARTVVLPVLLGQLARSIGPVRAAAARYKGQTKRASEVVLLLIIFNTFCEAFMAKGATLCRADLLALGVIMPALYTLLLLGGARLLDRTAVEPRDAVAALYCSSQKTLAFGLPLIRLMFAGHPDLAFYTAPIMCLHPLQLLVGSALRPTIRKRLKLPASADIDGR